MVKLLKHPEYFRHEAASIFSDLSNPYSRHRISQEQAERLLNRGRPEMAKRLVGAVNYLQAIAENPETRRILGSEFGLGNYVEVEHLEQVANQLGDLFSFKVDEVSNLTLYESMLQEGQFDEDARTADQIAKITPQEIERLTKEKSAESQQLIGELIDKTKNDLAGLKTQTRELEEPLSQRQALKEKIRQLESKIAGLNKTETVKYAAGKLFKKRALTQAEKSSQLASLQIQLDTARNELAGVENKIEQIGHPDASEIERLKERLNSLQTFKQSS